MPADLQTLSYTGSVYDRVCKSAGKARVIAPVASGPCPIVAGHDARSPRPSGRRSSIERSRPSRGPEVPKTPSSGSRGRIGPSRGKSKTLRHLAGTTEFQSTAVAAARHRRGAPSECRRNAGASRSRRCTAICSDAVTNLQTYRVTAWTHAGNGEVFAARWHCGRWGGRFPEIRRKLRPRPCPPRRNPPLRRPPAAPKASSRSGPRSTISAKG